MKIIVILIAMSMIKISGILLGWWLFVMPVFGLPMLTFSNVLGFILAWMMMGAKVDMKL